MPTLISCDFFANNIFAAGRCQRVPKVLKLFFSIIQYGKIISNQVCELLVGYERSPAEDHVRGGPLCALHQGPQLDVVRKLPGSSVNLHALALNIFEIMLK